MYVSIILLLMVDVIPLCLAHNYWLMLLPIMFYCNKQTDVIFLWGLFYLADVVAICYWFY